MRMIQPFGHRLSRTISTGNIRIRDPYIVADKETKQYFLFGTTDSDPWNGEGEGFKVSRSENLEEWVEEGYAFRPPQNFWANKNFWAPEVHKYLGKWYLIASFYAEGHHRGVQIFRSENIIGPYTAISDKPVTPAEWDCLDGTLYVENGIPCLIFSHEWTQIHDGAICAVELTEDLTAAKGDPVVLFHATDASWSVPDTGDVVQAEGENYVTDGPFLFHENGVLKMLWSSFAQEGYALGIAYSLGGSIRGPWRQNPEPTCPFGGHGMLFEDFSGRRLLALHAPNTSGMERLRLITWNSVTIPQDSDAS